MAPSPASLSQSYLSDREHHSYDLGCTHKSQEIKNAGSHSNQEGGCQERRNVLAQARGVNFNAWRRLPSTSSCLKEKPMKALHSCRVNFDAQVLCSWTPSLPGRTQHRVELGNGDEAEQSCEPIPECWDPPSSEFTGFVFSHPQHSEETTPVQSCVQMKALWRQTGITEVFSILCLCLRGKFCVYWN